MDSNNSPLTSKQPHTQDHNTDAFKRTLKAPIERAILGCPTHKVDNHEINP